MHEGGSWQGVSVPRFRATCQTLIRSIRTCVPTIQIRGWSHEQVSAKDPFFMGHYRTAGMATYHETPAGNRHRRNVSRRILDFRYLEYCLGQATVWSSVDRRVLPSFTDKYFQLATWMWGGGPFLVFAISSLTSMAFWIAIFWKWRLRIPVEGQVQMTSVSDATWPTVLVYNPLPSPYVSTTANPRTGLVRPACL
jgi:hypothetical protein